VWEQAGVDIAAAVRREGLYPESVDDLATYARRHGLLKQESPAVGDMVIFDEHVNLVVGVSGDEVTVIGGNQSDRVSEASGSPSSMGWGPVVGYFTPPRQGG
jgi:hypothetical protein